jgi:hypothetical protein
VDRVYEKKATVRVSTAVLFVKTARHVQRPSLLQMFITHNVSKCPSYTADFNGAHQPDLYCFVSNSSIV